MQIHIISRFLVTAFIWSYAASIGAQTPSESSENSKPTESTQHKQDFSPPPREHWEVTVTATRTPTSDRKTGQSLTIITSEDIETHGFRDILQVLETVPGFNVARTGSTGGVTSIFVRGGENDFNLVLMDGVQINQPGGAFDFADLTTTNVERIEIIRGPSSVLYGADAMTSVINIITKRGEAHLSKNLTFERGHFGSHLLRGGLSGETEKINYSLGAHYSESDGLHDLNNQYSKFDLSTHTSLKLNSSSSLTSTLRFTDSEYHFPTDSTGAILDPNDFRKTNEALFSIYWDNVFNNQYNTKVHYGFYRRHSQTFSIKDGIVDFFDNTIESTESRNYVDWENNFQLHPDHLVTGGISLDREASASENLTRQSIGVFLQDQFSWRNRLFVTAGVRYDHNDSFVSFSTASVSLSYLLDDTWKVRTSLGNGLRAPSFIEIAGLPEFDITGNPDLSPESNLAVDWGIDFASRNQKGSFSATAFFNHFDNLIEFSFLSPPGSPNYFNREAAVSKGLEVSTSIKPTQIMRVGGQYTWTTTKVTDSGTVPGGLFVKGDQLLRRPQHLAGIYAEFLQARYKLQIDLQYKGTRDDVQFFPDWSNARVVLPSYLKINFGLTIPLLGLTDSKKDLALLFRAENIFNKHYTEIAGFESQGRSLFVGLKTTF
ncbi:MAG: TonB-dependent receptor [Acidobacteriota bacterium]|nr:TonB-dependent receptor [Acidobacteriota bacterium]